MPEVAVSAISEQVGLRREAHLLASDLPMWLAKLHGSLPVDDTVRFSMSGSLPLQLDDLLEGAGFARDNGDLVRLHTLPDVIRADMDLLICGLNPSPHAAESAVGFSRPGNRFWPAAMKAGVLTDDRDPHQALIRHNVGFTDLVKRTTRRADELSPKEYQAGLPRLERLNGWLHPQAMVMVGLTGWRHATGNQKATSGWQPELLGGTPVYLMPNTSGLNAHETEASLADHLRTAQAGPPIMDLVR